MANTSFSFASRVWRGARSSACVWLRNRPVPCRALASVGAVVRFDFRDPDRYVAVARDLAEPAVGPLQRFGFPPPLGAIERVHIEVGTFVVVGYAFMHRRCENIFDRVGYVPLVEGCSNVWRWNGGGSNAARCCSPSSRNRRGRRPGLSGGPSSSIVWPASCYRCTAGLPQQ